jgi:hypothetical protein
LNGIAPRDEMIAAQMLACHDTAMGCFRDALNSKRHGRLWHEYLEQAGKLTRAFAVLLDALNHHRGKGQQKITVEQLHVHSGGQAVVVWLRHRGEGFSPIYWGEVLFPPLPAAHAKNNRQHVIPLGRRLARFSKRNGRRSLAALAKEADAAPCSCPSRFPK